MSLCYFLNVSKGNLFFIVSMVAVYVKRCLKVFANYGWRTVFASEAVEAQA